MVQHSASEQKKYRLTAFIDPILVKRAKVRGALEGRTISEVVEKALDAYAPKIEESEGQHIRLKFISGQAIGTVIPETRLKPKHKKPLVIPK